MDAFAVTESCGAGDENIAPGIISCLAQSRRRTGLSGSTGHLIDHSCRSGFFSMCFITRCCIPSYLTRSCRLAAGAFTHKNSTGANVSFQVIGVPDAGKKKTCRVSCASGLSQKLGGAHALAPFDGCRLGARLRRRGRRRYVLFDEVPKRCCE